jgi:acetyl esterase/lipase
MQTFSKNLSRENVTLTAYLHDISLELGNVNKRPAVLIFPGGAYLACSDREAEPVAFAFLAEGYNAFVLHYTVGKDSCPKALKDAEEALELLRQKAGEWNIYPDQIACVGFSAGGHLAASLGTVGRVKPNALILGYPCIMEQIGPLGQPIPGVDTKVDKSTPPSFLFSTRKDSLLPIAHTLAFADALDKAGVDFEVHIFQEGAHGLSLAKPLTADGKGNMVNASFSQWLPLSVNWLKTLWGDFPVGDVWEEATFKEKGVLNTPLSFLAKKNPLWAAILEKAPFLAAIKDDARGSDVTIAGLVPYVPGLTAEMLSGIEAVAKDKLG